MESSRDCGKKEARVIQVNPECPECGSHREIEGGFRHAEGDLCSRGQRLGPAKGRTGFSQA